MKSPSQYKVLYEAWSRGQHQLHVRSEVRDSPFNVTVYPDPTQLGTPVRNVTVSKDPWDIAINSHGEMVLSNIMNFSVSLLNSSGHEIQTYGSKDDTPHQMKYPTGVAVDSDDNVYVASQLKLQKFDGEGHLIKCVGCEKGDLIDPKGIKLHHGHVYVCDKGNNHIQVFDTDLNFIQTIGSLGSGLGQFDGPYDLDFDSEGKAYISDKNNHRIQMIDTSSQFVRQFGHEKGKGQLVGPTALHVMEQFVYVSDIGRDCVIVYQTSGQFVALLGKHGGGEGELHKPSGIVSDQNGFVYVAYIGNNSVQVF